jgi:hypothetical protein
MSKLLSYALVLSALFVIPSEYLQIAIAGTCSGVSCGRQPIQFVPGEPINFEVLNQTASLVALEKVQGTNAIVLNPGQSVSFQQTGSRDRNLSIVLWDVTGLPLKLNVSKAEARTLRIVVRPGGRPPGDRTVYLKNDGRVTVF